MGLWAGFRSEYCEMNVELINKFRTAIETTAVDYGVSLTPEAVDGMVAYYDLLTRWNNRLHLVAPTSPEEFALRHVLESLVLIEHLPPNALVGDIGSGGGLPIIPNLIARPDIQGVLIESSTKKAIFLREALSETGTSARATVIAARFENIDPPDVGFITSRALERFEEMVPQLVRWAPKNSVFLLFGGNALAKALESSGLTFTTMLIPNSKQRFLYVAKSGTQNE